MSFQKMLDAASQTVLAAIAAAQEDYAQNLHDVGSMRCEAQKYTSEDLERALKKPHGKNEGLMECERHGGYHIYSTSDFRALVTSRRKAFTELHAKALFAIPGDAKAQLGTEFERAAKQLAQADVRRYIDLRQLLVNQHKQDRVAKKTSTTGISTELLDEFYRCYRKRAHPTPAHARQHMDALNASSDLGGTLSVYQCSYCTGWHVGHIGGPSASRLVDGTLRAIQLLNKRNSAALEFCREKGLPLSVLS